MISAPPVGAAPARDHRKPEAFWFWAWNAGWWAWAIWSCAEHWRGDSNYSYGWSVPFLVAGFALRRAWLATRLRRLPETASERGGLAARVAALFLCAGLLVLPLEWARQEEWHPEIVLWTICLIAITCSAASVWSLGGRALFRAEIFPQIFFLTAVPWPPRFEQPITAGLMRAVARLTTEILHWSGVEAQASGAAIALRSGLVGITEACSGIRSLQAGLMFGLAMGEWFLLRSTRRVALLGVALGLAVLTNLVRTTMLCFQAEWHGLDAVERVHDFVGNLMITALIAGIWACGKALSPRRQNSHDPGAGDFVLWLRNVTRRLRNEAALASPRSWLSSPMQRSVLIALVAFASARGLHSMIEQQTPTQQRAFFQIRVGQETGNTLVPVPPSIWAELAPTSGEYVRRSPIGKGDAYHFFWKPSPWNRFALVHRPDICMPGVGWTEAAPPEQITVDLDGGPVRCYAFRFRHGEAEALQLWGIWRNGEPVSLQYTAAQALGAAVAPAGLDLSRKRGSATEIISCSIVQDDIPPSLEMAADLLQSVFIYRPSFSQ